MAEYHITTTRFSQGELQELAAAFDLAQVPQQKRDEFFTDLAMTRSHIESIQRYEAEGKSLTNRQSLDFLTSLEGTIQECLEAIKHFTPGHSNMSYPWLDTEVVRKNYRANNLHHVRECKEAAGESLAILLELVQRAQSAVPAPRKGPGRTNQFIRQELANGVVYAYTRHIDPAPSYSRPNGDTRGLKGPPLYRGAMRLASILGVPASRLHENLRDAVKND